MATYTHICANCGVKFTSYSEMKTYCSRECAQEKRQKEKLATLEKERKKDMLKKRRQDIYSLMRETGISNYAEVAYYYDNGRTEDLRALAYRRHQDGIIKPVQDCRRIARPHINSGLPFSPRYFSTCSDEV